MGEQFISEEVNDSNFRFLSVAALFRKIHNGIGIEELHREAERKFDTLIELLIDTTTDNIVFNRFGYSLDDMKEMALLIFNRLISNTSSNPYITLCASERASIQEIKRRRNKLLYIFHPDRNQDGLNNGNITMRINEAYETIANIYYTADDPFKFKYIKTRVPSYFSYRKKKMFTLFIVVLIFIITFLIVMKIN